MTIEEELGDLCAAYRKEIKQGTFVFTPFEKSVRFMGHLKRALANKEIGREDVFAMVQKLQKAVSEFDQALQGREAGDSEKQDLQVKQHKKLTFTLLAHQINEIKALLDQNKSSPPSSQPTPSKPRVRSSLRKRGWMRT